MSHSAAHSGLSNSKRMMRAQWVRPPFSHSFLRRLLRYRLGAALGVALYLAGSTSAALAADLPEGAHEYLGTATIERSDDISPVMTINQRNKLVMLNWDSFDIASDAILIVRSNEPHSLLLNRVTGQSPSMLAGSLVADGDVWLINPNGVDIHASAAIAARGFMTSTEELDLSVLGDIARSGQPPAPLLAGVTRAVDAAAAANVPSIPSVPSIQRTMPVESVPSASAQFALLAPSCVPSSSARNGIIDVYFPPSPTVLEPVLAGGPPRTPPPLSTLPIPLAASTVQPLLTLVHPELLSPVAMPVPALSPLQPALLTPLAAAASLIDVTVPVSNRAPASDARQAPPVQPRTVGFGSQLGRFLDRIIPHHVTWGLGGDTESDQDSDSDEDSYSGSNK